MESSGLVRTLFLGTAMVDANGHKNTTSATPWAPEASELKPGVWDMMWLVEYEDPQKMLELTGHPVMGSGMGKMVVADQRWLPWRSVRYT